MSARPDDYGVPRTELPWDKAVTISQRESIKTSPEAWSNARQVQGLACESSGIDASVSTQVGVLSTFVRLIDERDKRTLAATVSRLKELEQLAEAKLRFALNSERTIARAPKAPRWFEDIVQANLDGCLPSAIGATGQLLASLGEKWEFNPSEVDIQAGPDGIVIVALGNACRWFVSPSRLPWPGCDVRLYKPEQADSLKLRVEHHRLVSTLLDSTVTPLNEDGR